MKKEKEIMVNDGKLLTKDGIVILNDNEYICKEYGIKTIGNNIIEFHDLDYIIEKILDQKKYDRLIE